MLPNCTALAAAAYYKPFGALMYLHNSCAWLGSFVRQATTEAAATETAKVTPIALFMSFSCRYTHTHKSFIGCHTAQPFVYHAMQLSMAYWLIDPFLVCWHALKSMCISMKHKLTYQLVDALCSLHDLFAPMLRLHCNCCESTLIHHFTTSKPYLYVVVKPPTVAASTVELQ